LYEKGISPENTTMALLRAIELAQQFANAKVASEIIDVKHYKFEGKSIKLNPTNVNNALGVELKLPKMKEILESLGFKVSAKVKEFTVEVPWWRVKDVEGEHDLVEEIARIYGYHNLPTNLMTGEIPADYNSSDQFFWEWKVKNIFSGIGYFESYNYSFISEKLIKACGLKLEDHVEIDNPLSSDFQYMRTSLIPSLLQMESENEAMAKKIKTFELSRIYIKKGNSLPEEISYLSFFNSDDGADSAFSNLKGTLEDLLEKMHISDWKLEEKNNLFVLSVSGEEVGSMMGVGKNAKSAIGIKKEIAICEINFEKLIKFAKTTPAYMPLPKYPAIELDLSMEIASNVLFADVASHAKQVSDLIENVEFLSVYEGDKIETGKKALAIRLTYRNSEKTLELSEAQSVHEKVVTLLQKEYGIRVR
jgi:phenylalanyl-tRNA synthetase beta chain